MNPLIVYCHIHVESNRRYIGLTKHSMLKRWNRHVYSANKIKNGKFYITSHFSNAIRKYGKDAFSHEILGKNLTLEEANELEKEKILEFDTRNPEKGFNIMKGGGFYQSNKIKNPWDRPEYRAKMLPLLRKTPKTKAKISASLMGHVMNEDTKKKISIAGKGKILNSEIRKKIAVSNTGKFHTVESKLRMSNIQKSIAATSDSKVKRSKATKGRILSFETKLNLSKINTGKSISIETRLKNSNSMKKYKMENLLCLV